MRTRTLSTLGLTSVLGLSLALFGCGSSDDGDPTGPGGGGGGVTDTEAVMAADFATPVAIAMVEQAVAVAALDLNGLNEGPPMDFGQFGEAPLQRALEPSFSISWDEAEQEWVVMFADNQMPAMASTFQHRVQYRDVSGSPQGFQQESPETTDGARFGTAATVYMDFGMVMQDPNISGSVDVDYSSDATIAGLLGSTYTAVGSGSYSIDIDMTASQEGQTQTLDLELDMSYAMDVSVPVEGGCASGTAAMVYDGYRVDVTFDGTATSAWSLTRLSDDAVLLTGTESMDCGSPAAR